MRPRCARWHRQLWIKRKNHFVVLVFIVGEKKKKKKSFPGSTVDVHSPDMHTGRSHAVNIVTKLPHRPDKVTHSARREQLYKKISEIVKKTHPGHLWNDRVPRLSRFTRRRTVGTGVDADTETEQLYL